MNMLKSFALALPLAFTATLAAAEPPVEAAFGNTVVTTFPDGRTQLLWLNKDGTYTAKGRRRTDSSGRWTMKGEDVCLKQLKPIPMPITYCTRIPPNADAVTWTAKAVNGEPIKLKVVRGKAS
jgi:hypothetical protein